ncbi:MAG: penicillin-binding protein 2 [Candidatus Marinimicrobia bacterium]|nr:penicillin-binding protein 2 [Candidatus Neomarinimicrobiota bacterium]|tara:strand:- start:106 stop:1863 length:1758 start_codon:yes stop_codon:yes gene_type:complete
MLKADNIVTYRQFLAAAIITWCLFGILIGRFFQIQVLEYDWYSEKANSNRIRKVTTTAPRGLILDRNGQILVDNFSTYVLTAIPWELSDKGEKFEFISKVIGLNSNTVSKNYKKYYRGRFNPTRLAKDLTFGQVSRLEENRIMLQGVYYENFPERYFPSRIRGSHIFGIVKEVDRNVRNNLKNKNDYELGDMIGWSGIEKQYENYLKGRRGISFYEVDAFGRELGYVNELDPTKPEPGMNIITTLDLNVQYLIEEIMKDKKGVILVSLADMGEILGAVSAPDFDPELFTGLILETTWKEIRDHPEKPLLNRYLQGTYPPGSIVKMITQAALIEKAGFDPNIKVECNGSYQFGDRLFGCWWEEGHGELDFSGAMINSCDIYFYQAVQSLELNQLAEMFVEFGFGKPSKIDIPGEVNGLVPNKNYMNKRHGRYNWSKGALLNICIGQGEILVTPIQVLNYLNLLATKGLAFRPHLVMVDEPASNDIPEIKDETWDRIISDMRLTIIDENGTGKKAQPDILGMDVYGKTGTAENAHGESHAWFIGWAEYYYKKYSLVILLENAGSGGKVAAPIAKTIFKEIARSANTL